MAQDFFSFGLSLSENQESELCNPALRMLGHIALDKAQPKAALDAYTRCMNARVKLIGSDMPGIADVLDSIGCSYTEMGENKKSFDALEQAVRIHKAHDPKQMARTTFILSMAYLRDGKPDDALVALRKCWDLQGLTQDQVAISRYPKHSGDLVLLPRIELDKGNAEEALQLASKTVTIRKGIFGNKGPRVADSMYTVAKMLIKNQNKSLAAKLLMEIIAMGEGMLEMEGHLARALWMLAYLEEEFGHDIEASAARVRARDVRAKIQGREGPDDDTDESFNSLVPWLLP